MTTLRFPLTPTLSRLRERELVTRCCELSLARLREREGPAAQRWEGEGEDHSPC